MKVSGYTRDRARPDRPLYSRCPLRLLARRGRHHAKGLGRLISPQLAHEAPYAGVAVKPCSVTRS